MTTATVTSFESVLRNVLFNKMSTWLGNCDGSWYAFRKGSRVAVRIENPTYTCCTHPETPVREKCRANTKNK